VKTWLKFAGVYILFGIFGYVSIAESNFQTRQLLVSCYQMPYDSKKEMTDVTLIDAYYIDQSVIKMLANKVILREAANRNSSGSNDLLSGIFASQSMSHEANIQFFRERSAGDYYRLDLATNLNNFTNYKWNDGQFTNAHPFILNRISNPPNGTNQLWTLYDAQPGGNSVGIRTGETPLLFNEGFYLNLFGLPPLLRLNVLMQTVYTKSAQEHDFSISGPDGFR
jgi:hypothetical protein